MMVVVAVVVACTAPRPSALAPIRLSLCLSLRVPLLVAGGVGCVRLVGWLLSKEQLAVLAFVGGAAPVFYLQRRL